MECVWRPGSREGEAAPWDKSWFPEHAGSLTSHPQGVGGMHHCSGRNLEGVFDGVAQEKQGGWTEFNGKINSRGKSLLLFSFFATAEDTSGIRRKLPPASHLQVVQESLWLGMQWQRRKLLGDSRPGAAEKSKQC